MRNYNNKIVANYIMGNDLEEYDIDELEDDVSFMKDVMKMSVDKEMYRFCSEKVKNDPSFVTYVISLFSHDEDFITKVADEFLRKTNDNIARTEIYILMNKYLDKDAKRYLEFAVLLFGFTLEKDTMITAAKDLYKNDPEHLSLIGETGFSLLYEEYKQSTIITNYFAEKSLEKIFHTDSAEFEDLFHKLFKTAEELDKTNMRTYLIDYISNYDSELASYIGSHPELLNKILNEISVLKNKWNSYQNRIDVKKYNMMFEKVHNYMEEFGHNCSYTEDELLYAIGEELGIAREIYEHDQSMPKEEDMPYEEALPDTIELDKGVISYDDLSIYNSLKEIILKFLKAKSLKDLEDIEEEYAEPSEEEKKANEEIDNMLEELGLNDQPTPSQKNKPSNIIDFRTATKK